MTNLNHFAARKNVHFDGTADLRKLPFAARSERFSKLLTPDLNQSCILDKEQDEPHNAA